MVVVYTHHSRDVVAMMEHALIDAYDFHPMCANRKKDFDNHIRNDDSCSENEGSEGLFTMYICHGVALPSIPE